MAYYGLFHSRLDYAVTSWGHAPSAEIVFKIQRRAIRVLAHKGYREDCRDDFVELKVLTLYSSFAYKCAIYAHQHPGLFKPPQHKHNTRFVNKDMVAVPYNRIDRVKNITNYWAVKTYNKLDKETRKMPLTQFKVKVKKYFTEKALYSLNEL